MNINVVESQILKEGLSMKSIKPLIFLIFLAIGIAAVWKIDMGIMKLKGSEISSEEKDSGEQERIRSYLDDAAIIRNAFESIGVLGVLEGKEQYKQLVEEENWYSYRSINIDWHYRFSIALNLNELDIEVKDGVVNISVDRKNMFIWFVEKTGEGKSTSYASWFARKYSAREIEMFEKAVVEKVQQRIKDTEKYWTEAEKSLENNLLKLCAELGYSEVRFEYI